MTIRVALSLLGLCAACRTELPAPRPLPAPPPDGRAPLLAAGPLSPRIASYRLRADLDVAQKRIQGQATLTWRHTGVAPVSELPFHLYMNGFKNETTVLMRESRGAHRLSSRADDDEAWGWIEVPSIRFEGAELRAGARHGEDETTLTVPLPRPVAPGETIVVELDFTTRLPRVFMRTGHAEGFFMVGQWFPKIGVLDVRDGAQAWHARTFHHNSEFYADFGTYDVELTVPDTHVVAATGVLTAVATPAPGRRAFTYRAEDVHDFAWMADPHMKVLRGTARNVHGEVEVRVYHRPGYERYAPRHLEAAQRTITTFSDKLIPYPWPIMNVIDPPWEALGAFGMEYPMLVTAGGALPLDGQRFPEQVTVHEVGHNWFQGMLASNEVEEAWLDEGINEYADGLVLDEWLGADRSLLVVGAFAIGYYERYRFTDLGEYLFPVATPSYAIPKEEYGELTYSKTARILKTLEGMVGRDRLVAALGLYARRNAFKHPTRADFFAALRDGLGEDYGWFLEPALLGIGDIDYRVGPLRVRRAEAPRGVFGEGEARRLVTDPPRAAEGADAWSSEVTIERHGRLAATVEIAMRFSDGTTLTESWDGRGPQQLFSYEKPARLVEVEIDPGGKLNLEHHVLDNARGPRQAGPSWRAGARAGFWLQTAAQVVGL